jgi:hypothetical protein
VCVNCRFNHRVDGSDFVNFDRNNYHKSYGNNNRDTITVNMVGVLWA